MAPNQPVYHSLQDQSPPVLRAIAPIAASSSILDVSSTTFWKLCRVGVHPHGARHPLEQPVGHHQGFAIKAEGGFCMELMKNLLLYQVYFRGISSIFS